MLENNDNQESNEMSQNIQESNEMKKIINICRKELSRVAAMRYFALQKINLGTLAYDGSHSVS